jgi:hypothetical protein
MSNFLPGHPSFKAQLEAEKLAKEIEEEKERRKQLAELAEKYKKASKYRKSRMREQYPDLFVDGLKRKPRTSYSRERTAKYYKHKRKPVNNKKLELIYYPSSRLVRSNLYKKSMPMVKVVEVLAATKLPFVVTETGTGKDVTDIFAAKLLLYQFGKFLEVAPTDPLLAMAENWQTTDTLFKSFTKLLHEIKLNASTDGPETATDNKQEAT